MKDNWPGPEYDHTLQRIGGSYLYMTALQTTLEHKIGVIESMITPLKTPKCLSFWTQMKGNDTILEAFLVRYGPMISDKARTMILIPPIKGEKSSWTKVSYNTDPTSFAETDVFAVQIRGTLMKFKNESFIALDDIMLSDGQCPDKVSNLFFCKVNGQQLDLSKRCDFVYDCPQKDDEDNCGNCDFEKGIKFNCL